MSEQENNEKGAEFTGLSADKGSKKLQQEGSQKKIQTIRRKKVNNQQDEADFQEEFEVSCQSSHSFKNPRSRRWSVE